MCAGWHIGFHFGVPYHPGGIGMTGALDLDFCSECTGANRFSCGIEQARDLKRASLGLTEVRNDYANHFSSSIKRACDLKRTSLSLVEYRQ